MDGRKEDREEGVIGMSRWEEGRKGGKGGKAVRLCRRMAGKKEERKEGRKEGVVRLL